MEHGAWSMEYGVWSMEGVRARRTGTKKGAKEKRGSFSAQEIETRGTLYGRSGIDFEYPLPFHDWSHSAWSASMVPRMSLHTDIKISIRECFGNPDNHIVFRLRERRTRSKQSHNQNQVTNIESPTLNHHYQNHYQLQFMVQSTPHKQTLKNKLL